MIQMKPGRFLFAPLARRPGTEPRSRVRTKVGVNTAGANSFTGTIATTLALVASCVFGVAARTSGAQPQRSLEPARPQPAAGQARDYHFDKTISREVLENYLSRSISMEGLLNGRGNLEDNVRMLRSLGAKFIGRSLCLWGGEAKLLRNLERAKEQMPLVRRADPEMILQACVFEIVSTQVEQVPVPDWVFIALGQPVEK